MFKAELINEMAAKSELSKKACESALDAFVATVTDTIACGEKVQIVGFGSFETVERAAREGRNPATGEQIQIAATKAPKFKPGKALKEAVKA